MPLKAVSDSNRHWIVAIFMQLGIRLRYFFFESFFGLKPFFSPLTAYPSKWRPKNCPQYDAITSVGFVLMWFTAAFAREVRILYFIYAHTGILHLMNAFHNWLGRRLVAQFKANGYSSAHREIPIPEYDWKNGNPDEFYKTFVSRPHPVILRGFMDDTDLLKELNWDSVMSKYSEEDVFLTKKEQDGYSGKLKEVNNPNVYLHNSEKLFQKFPAIR
jgi:hypothetical protein